MAKRRPAFAKFNKPFASKKVKIDGITWDSIAEAGRWNQLKLMQQAGLIKNLAHKPKLPLMITNIKTGAVEKLGRGYFTADFEYDEYRDGAWRHVIEDYKGAVDYEMSALRRRIAELVNGVEIKVVRKTI